MGIFLLRVINIEKAVRAEVRDLVCYLQETACFEEETSDPSH